MGMLATMTIAKNAALMGCYWPFLLGADRR
jgi:hypothetical protein